jgi:hypothetical protein
MSASVGRNDPCPCGSGLKYKHCHAGKMRLTMGGRRGWLWGLIGLIVVAAAAWGVMRSQSPANAPTRMVMTPQPISPGASSVPSTGAAPTATAPAAGVTPQPWEYDAARNRHYDPNHGHYHEGPPPPPEARVASAAGNPGTAPAGPTPAAWTYDAKNNQHWDPNHGHWHQGPPPPVGSR